MIEFYPMNLEFARQVAAIEPLCFDDPWSEKSVVSEVTNPLSHWIVAVEGERVVGYVGSHTVLSEADVMNLGVHPDYRCHGLGRQLMEQLEGDLREKDVVSLTLEVRPSNLSARKVYERQGFAQVGCRKNYYKNPKEDGLILKKEWEL